jgi:glucosamine-phosphate N-acetyltransferase
MEYNIRPLNKSDYTNYLQLINQFRATTFTEEEYNRTLQQIHMHSTIWVLEHKNELIGTITILYEYKFIRNIVKLAHVEDVCIDRRYRKKGLGTLLLKFAISEAKKKECYKIILDCDETLEPFYNKSGMIKNGIQMVKYF